MLGHPEHSATLEAGTRQNGGRAVQKAQGEESEALLWSLCALTVCRRQMFSRRDPIQPQKVRRNIRTPTTISRMAGSTARQAKAASGREADPQLEPSALQGGSQEWMAGEGCTHTVLPALGESPCLVMIMRKQDLPQGRTESV